MKEISLTQGKVALVDDGDYAYLSQFTWHAELRHTTWYAKRNLKRAGKWTTTFMHRDILQVPSWVDHINHNGLDNQRHNLRPCTTAENIQNSKRSRGNTSGYKGVSWNKKLGKWAAYIRLEGRLKHLGVFRDPVEAARAYDVAAVLHFGQFAAVNFPMFDMAELEAA